MKTHPKVRTAGGLPITREVELFYTNVRETWERARKQQRAIEKEKMQKVSPLVRKRAASE